MSQSIYSIWCMKRYAGEQAKHVLSLSALGVGYYILERPDTGSAWVVAAFRRASGPLPSDVTEIKDERLIQKIEKFWNPMGNKEDRTLHNTVTIDDGRKDLA